MQRGRRGTKRGHTSARLWFGLLAGGGLLVLGLLLLDTLTSRSPETRKAAYVQQGEDYFQAAKYREAILAWQHALQLDPTLAQTHYHLGLAYLKLAWWQEAITAFHTSVRLAPDLTEAQLQLGELYLVGNHAEHARATAQRVAEHDPTSVEGYLLLSKSAATAGEYATALHAVHQALNLAPERLEALLLLGALHFTTHELTQAEHIFQQAVTTHATQVNAHLALGNFYQATGHWPQAEAAYRTAIEVEPQSSQAHLLLGHAYASRNQVDAAVDHFQQALALDPTRLEAKKHLVYLLLGTQHTTQAARLSAELLTSQPRDLDSLYLQGRVQLAQRDVPGALQTLQRVVDTDPAYHFGAYPADVRYWLGLAYYLHEQFSPASQELRAVLAQYPTSTPLKLLVAELALRLGEPWSARDKAWEVVQAEPRHLQALLLLGQAYVHTDQLPDATTAFQTAMRVAPKDPRGYHGLGLVYERQQRFPDAIRAFVQVLTVAPDAVEALAHLVALYQAVGQPLQARQRCTAHLAQVPHQAAMQQVCGQLLLAQHQDAAAEAHLPRALTLDPTRPEPHFYLGVLAEQHGDHGQARAQYEQALALAPTFALAANNVAWLYAEHGGDLARAAQLAEMAREQLPHAAPVLDTLGWIYYKQKRFQRALVLLQESVQHAPSNPAFHFHLGMAYAQIGDLNVAQRTLEQALALSTHGPNAEAIRHALAALRQ